MNTCDRCAGEMTDNGQYLHIEVEFLTNGARGARDERKLQASLCPRCYEVAERVVTDVLGARSVFPAIEEPAAAEAQDALAVGGRRG